MMLAKNHALLHIVDIQEKLFNVMHNKEAIKENMVRLLKGIQLMQLPILWMEQYPQGLGPTIPELKDLMQDAEPMEKMSFSSCKQPDFIEALKVQGRKQILVMGIEAHVCVYQTVIGLISRGYDVHVVADAISSRTEKNCEFGLRAMEAEGARITSVEMALFELLESAESEHFRKISRIIK